MSASNIPGFIEALGTDTDAAIGRRFGVTPRTVANHRTRLGIPSHRKASKGSAIEALLGQGLSDSEIARRAGVDRAAVRRRRQKRGIENDAAVRAQETVDRVLAFKASHPGASLRAIENALDISKSRVAQILKAHMTVDPRDEAKPLLGTMSDAKLGAKVGASEATVASWRKAEGVAAFGRNAGLDITGDFRFRMALGTDEDTAIGKRFGVSREVVKHHRTRLGIPSFREQRAAFIQSLLDEGMSVRAVAREAGVSPAAVRKQRDSS